MKRATLLVACLLLAAPVRGQEPAKPSPAQDPTIEETWTWLKGRLEQYGTTPEIKGFSQAIISVELKDCVLTIRKSSNFSPIRRKLTEEASIPLNTLDPNQVKVFGSDRDSPNAVVRLGAAGEKKNINLTGIKESAGQPPENYQQSSAYFALYIKDDDMAERIAKAFSHLITKCGGKADPF